MPDERIVYWRAIADFSKVRNEARKTRREIKDLNDEVDDLNASNERLGKSEDAVAAKTKKSGDAASSAAEKKVRAKERETEATKKSTKATIADTLAAVRANAESARTVKQAQQEAKAANDVVIATERIRTARDNASRAAQKVQRAENDLARVQKSNLSTARQIAKAQQDLAHARDQEARAVGKIKEANLGLQHARQRESSILAENAHQAAKASLERIEAEAKVAKAAEDRANRIADATARQDRIDARTDRLLQARRDAADRREADRLAREQAREENVVRQTILRNNKLLAEYDRLAAAKRAADSAARRTAPTRDVTMGRADEVARLRSGLQGIPDRRSARSQITALNALTRAEEQLKAARDAEIATYARINEAESKLAVATSNVAQARAQARSAEADYSDALSRSSASSREALEADQRRIAANTNLVRTQNVERDSTNAVIRARNGVSEVTDRVERAERRFADSIRNADRELRAAGGGGNRFTRFLGGLGGAFKSADNAVNRFFHSLRAIRWPALAGGVYILVAAVSTLVSGLFELGSAIGPAVGALGAAIPVAYALAGAFGAVRAAFAGVGGALKAYQQAQMKAAVGSGKAANTEVNNTDAIISAQERLRDARAQVGIAAREGAQQVVDAQQNIVDALRAEQDAQNQLSDARRQAARNIADLKNAAVDAALAERGAALDLADAQANLQRVLNDPSASRADRERAQLQVDMAVQGQKEAGQQASRATTESRAATTAGVSGDPQVIAAKRQLADATKNVSKAEREYRNTLADASRSNAKAIREVTTAQRALARAQRTANTETGAASTAADTYQYKLSKLSPAAQAFVKKLISMQTYLAKLKATAASNMFPGLTRGLDRLPRLFPVINSGLAGISREVGTLGDRFSRMITTPRWISAFRQLGDASVPILDNIGNAAMYIVDALRAVGVAAIPLAKRLTGGFAEWAKQIDKTANAAQKSGRLTRFFERTYHVLHQLGQITKNVIMGFYNMGRAASGPGQDMLDSMDSIVKKWREWTESDKGQGQLRKFFTDVRANMKVIDHYIGVITKGFLNMGASKSLKPILEGLGDIFNALKEAFGGNGGEVGKAFVNLLHTIARVIRTMSGESDGLKVFIGTLDTLLSILNGFLKLPGASVLVGGFLAFLAVFKAARLLGIVALVERLGRAMGAVRRESTGVSRTRGALGALFGRRPPPDGGAAGAATRRPTPGPGPVGGAPVGGAPVGTRRPRPTRRPTPDPTNRIIRGTDEALGRPTPAGTTRLVGSQSINLRTGQITENAPTRPTPPAPVPPQGRIARLRARLPRGDAGSASAGLLGGGFGRVGRAEPRPRGRMGRIGRGVGAGAGIGIGVAGMALGDMINDGRGGARQAVGGAISGAASGAMLGAMFGPIGMGVGALAGGVVGLLQNSKIGQKIKDWFLKTVWPAIKRLPQMMVQFGKDMLYWITWPFTESYKVVTEKLGPLSSIIRSIFGGITDFFKGLFSFWKNLFLGVFNIIKDIVTGNFGDIWNQIKRIFGGIWDYIKGVLGLIKGLFRAQFTAMKAIATTIWAGIKLAIVNPIKDAFAAVKSAWTAVWSWLTGKWNAAKGIAKTIWSSIAGAISSAFNGVGRALSSVWTGIENVFATAINFVTQKIINKLIGAINWVITKFGMSAISKISPITVGGSATPQKSSRASSGRATSAAEGNVLPGYSPGSDTRTFVDQHGYRLKLSGGEGILTPETTRALGGKPGIDALNAKYSPRLRNKPRFKRAARTMGAYADGGGLENATLGTENQRLGYNKWALWRFMKMAGSALNGDGVLGGIGKAFGSAVGLIRKGAGAVVKGTFEGMEAPIRALVNNIPHVGFLKGLTNGLFDKVNQGVYNVIAGRNGKSKTSVRDDARYTGKITGDNAKNDIMVSGLALNNKTDMSMGKKNYRDRMVSAHKKEIDALRILIENESAWDTNAINRTDSNAKAGHPSQGLMQTIPATFAAFRNPNLDRGITDGVANVTAGINYADNRYGGVSSTPGVHAVGGGGRYVGYADGGVQYFHKGGVVKGKTYASGALVGMNRRSNNSLISGLLAQAGIAFPSGPAPWYARLTTKWRQRLAGVNAGHDRTSGALPHAQSPLSFDSKTTQGLMSWVDAHDPRSYGSLWSRQPYGRANGYLNSYHRNPLLPILSYVGSPSGWANYRTKKDAAYWSKLAAADTRKAQGKDKNGKPRVTATHKGFKNLDSVKKFIRRVDNKPYVYGAVGPDAYDCSGLTGEVWARLTGHPSYRRYFTTHNEARYFSPGKGDGVYVVGVTNNSNEEHTAGRLDGLKFEARSSNSGIIVGGQARNPESFAKVFHLPAHKIKGVAGAAKDNKKVSVSVADEKKKHPHMLAAQRKQEAEWKRDISVLSGATKTEKSRIGLVRKYLGLTGAGNNSGLWSSDMDLPADHAAAHAIGISHPADWPHPWQGQVTEVEKALGAQDRANALNQEWFADLTTIATWGFEDLVDWLLDKGITDGLSVARSAVKDKKTAKQLNDSIHAGKVIGGVNGDDQINILKIIAKLGSGTAGHPFGLRDVAADLNVADYVPVNLFDKMTEQLKKLPAALTAKFKQDVGNFRAGTFYANTGGIVPGDRGQDRDIMPAMLTPGEGVLSRRAMALVGENNLNKLNQGIKPQFFASGGMVLSPSFASLGLGSSAGRTANASGIAAQGAAGYGGPAEINLYTEINNPTGESSVYTQNKMLQKQAALGTIAKAAGVSK